MNLDLALFDGDKLLQRVQVRVGPERTSETFELFSAHHQLGPDSAKLILDNFSENFSLKRSLLDIPIHESEDWESIDLGGYTLALWCRIDA